jgi:phenylacetyl-CoA:acceptor oxidoreductase
MHWWDEQLKEYQALPAWKDFPALWEAIIGQTGGRSQDYPFWLLTARSMQYAWGANVGMQLMREVADNVTGHRGVIINAQAAMRLGIADGDAIEISTPKRSVRGRAVVRQGIRPDTLLLIGQFEHWKTPLAADFGVPSMNSLATMSLALTDATGSGADIVRVKIGPAPRGSAVRDRTPGRDPARASPAVDPGKRRDSAAAGGRATAASGASAAPGKGASS